MSPPAPSSVSELMLASSSPDSASEAEAALGAGSSLCDASTLLAAPGTGAAGDSAPTSEPGGAVPLPPLASTLEASGVALGGTGWLSAASTRGASPPDAAAASSLCGLNVFPMARRRLMVGESSVLCQSATSTFHPIINASPQARREQIQTKARLVHVRRVATLPPGSYERRERGICGGGCLPPPCVAWHGSA